MLGVMPDEEKMMEEIARSLETRDGEFGRMYEDTLPEASQEGTKKKHREPGGFAAFLAAFGASLLLFAAILLGAFSLSGGGGEGSVSSAPAGSVSADLSLQNYRPTAADSGRMLVICGGEGDPGRAFFWLLRIDPRNGVMTVLSLPDGAETESGTLLSAASESASRAAAEAAELLGLDGLTYIRLSKADAAAIVDGLGGMEWTFRDRYQSDTLDIPPGERLLDGETLLTLLEDAGGGSGLPEPAEILTALLGQKFTEEAFNKDDGLFELLAGHSTGELSVVDYYEHKQYIRWFLHLGAGYRTITLSGAPGETRALSEGEIHLAREEMGLDG